MSPPPTLIALLVFMPLLGCGGSGGGSAAPDTREEARDGRIAPPHPRSRLPRKPGPLAERLSTTRNALHLEIDRWLGEADPHQPAPHEVRLHALHQQRIYVLLSGSEQLAEGVLRRLRGAAAAEARDSLAARRRLGSLSDPVPRRYFRTGPAPPAGVLLGYYREAERRFGVAWEVLAAVHFVESAFGRLRNESTAGARGPMQFIPSTWQAYGMGGDIQDPRDAIMGAANYLDASGAPEDYGRALFAYNRSSSYVDAVLRYAGLMRRDRHAYFAFHSWQVFVNTPAGLRRLTGPGIGPARRR